MYLVIPRETTKNLYKEMHSKTLQASHSRSLKNAPEIYSKIKQTEEQKTEETKENK